MATEAASPAGSWSRYSRALVGAMAEVLGEVPEGSRPNVLETAEYWLAVGLTLGLERTADARRLLELIEADEAERGGLVLDATEFIEEVLG